MTTGNPRPVPLSTKSFTRYEPAAPARTASQRHRASTLESSTPSRLSIEQEREDVFNQSITDVTVPDTPDLGRAPSLPDKFDELPIELASLTDRFIDSLGQKAFEQPPSIDQIVDLFQEFYIRASTSISIHISTLISRLNRDPSPKPLKPLAKSRTLSNKVDDETPVAGVSAGAQQMLTATEVAEKRKARKMLEYKRLLLEEAVERRACEKVYRKLWRHKSTLDEVQDEKLRSKTAALALVGIGLKDLGIDLDPDNVRSIEDVQELLLPARDGLIKMNEEKSPLGKLQHLTKAHKAIVDTLYSIHGSSSSADEILPTLIYTLITSPIEGINIISNLNFIQRFRTASKIDGEAAYCMTNLEAAISFLENVDLASLRADEFPEGPKKAPSQPDTPTVERSEPFPLMGTTASSVISASAPLGTFPDARTKLRTTITPAQSLPSPRHQRTLSDLLQPVAAANEAVRLKANEGIENIANTLDNSFKFLFGRLKEKAADPTSPKDMIVPKTLDEAMQLVSKPAGPNEDSATLSETGSLTDRELSESPALDKTDRVLSLFGNRRPGSVRDRSVDSQKSNASSRRVTFGPPSVVSETTSTSKDNSVLPTTPGKPLDSVKNLGSSLNPFATIGSAFGNSFGRFARPTMPATTNSNLQTADEPKKQEMALGSDQSDASMSIPLDSPEKVASRVRKVAPPVRRFVEMEDASELKIKDVADLLRDYKRLANLLNQLAAGDS